MEFAIDFLPGSSGPFEERMANVWIPAKGIKAVEHEDKNELNGTGAWTFGGLAIILQYEQRTMKCTQRKTRR